MSLKDILFLKKKEQRFSYLESTTPLKLGKTLFQLVPKEHSEVVVICIGTDRSTGDSLGPLVGTFLKEFELKSVTVYGTLHLPIHAKNLEQQIEAISKRHHNPYIIAIDACLGRASSIGTLICGVGSIQPGAAVQKNLPNVGDVYISGVVNVHGYMEYFVLQNTRLSVVMEMAKQIARSIKWFDQYMNRDRKQKENWVN
ncbi:spore protease YyaC [Salirhabdus salicampi]|uniref:spore protease YyaC n=1 Tax=Salirhabdus salicampi TaxID=476102 RepID=UPI0020C32358|nr:spore protease YyaC [Salirhabdus salicampi]MCP8617215.1 spore protease YyaC [Salirhabdus salicampi]